jgi:CheY-like chemotaxis protein
MKLLFADDDTDTRTIITLGFTIAGHEVLQATNGEEAVTIFKENRFDLVIMDLEMPVMDGWDAIHHIRRTAAGANIPIVVLTAYYMPHYQAKVRDERIDMVLSKPIVPQLLMQFAEELLYSLVQPQPTKK